MKKPNFPEKQLSGEEMVEITVKPTCDRERDSLALVALYASTNGPIWTQRWNLNDPIGSWFGVQFTPEGCVRSIKLPNNRLQGALPQEIGNLESLEELWLQLNFIVGPLPDTLTNCRMLRDIRLFNNSISGTLPEGLGTLDSLRFLNLARNTIRGPIPENLGNLTHLNYLSLGTNRLDDTIPESIANLTQLTLLDLSDNRFVGPIPAGIGNLTRLTELYLYNNQLTGTIPTSITNISDLRMLWLHLNRLEGALPDVNDLPLVSLRLEFNRLEDLPDLSGLNTLGNTFPNGLTVQYNRLTFEDIIPNLLLQASLFSYIPQDSIGELDTMYLFEGDDFVWDLGIDPGIPDNNYTFLRNDTVLRYQNSSEFIIPNLRKSNAGVYTAEVSNFNVPDLELFSRPVILVVRDTTGCGEPAPGIDCFSAPFLCDARDLDGYCGTLPDSVNITTPRPLCSMGIPENAHWISFVASEPEMAIRVIPSSCQGVINNNVRVAGMQGAIFNSCNFSTATALDCTTTCHEDPFVLSSDQFIPGATYWLILDGCVADVCDYGLQLIAGNSRFQLPQPDTIFGGTNICFGQEYSYFIPDTSVFTTEYIWYTSTGDTITTNRSMLEYTWTQAGNVELCVAALNDCDTTAFYCQDYFVPEEFRSDTASTFCVMDKTGFRAIIDLKGGNPPYTLIEGEGSIDPMNNRFSSDTLENDSTYILVFQDAAGCFFDTTVYFNCICESSAGTMSQELLELCANDTAIGISLGGTFLDPEDDSLYIVHDLPGNRLGNILLVNKTGVFVYDPDELEFGKTYYISLVVGNSNGTNGVRLSDPCLSVAPGQPFVFYEDAFADAGSDAIICGLEGFLEASLPYGTGRWQICAGPGQVLIDDPGSPSTRVQVGEPGNYRFCWTANVGSCTDMDTVQLFFNRVPELTIGGDSIFCQGSMAELIAEGDFIGFQWSTGENTRVINVDEHGTYCVTATDEANCTVEECVTLDLIPRPTPLIEGPSAVCQNGQAVLTVTEAYDAYLWSTGETTRTVTVEGPGVYCVTVTGDFGCQGSRCYPLSLLFDGVANISDTICFGETYSNGSITADRTGNYQFTLERSSANGCDSIVNLDLLVLDSLSIRDTIIQPDLGNNTGVISIQLRGGLPPYDIVWNNGQRGNTIVGLAAGPYTAVVTDAKGCFKIFVLMVPRVTGTQDFEQAIQDWAVLPNPVEQGREWIVSWTAKRSGEATLQLLDITGRQLWSQKWNYQVGQSYKNIAPEVPPGVYWLQWTEAGGIRSVLPVVVH